MNTAAISDASTGPDCWTELRESLGARLSALRNSGAPLIRQCAEALPLCHAAVRQLEASVLSFTFPDLSMEVRFFKEVRPYFYAQLLFYTQLHDIEIARPLRKAGDLSPQLTYLQQQIDTITPLYDRYQPLNQYLATAATFLDEQLFTSCLPNPLAGRLLDPSPEAAVLGYGWSIARLTALNQLRQHLADTIHQLKHPEQQYLPAPGGLVWTDSKTSLVELGYALQSIGSINSGKATLREIMESLQTVFQINLGNYPRTFQDCLTRKASYTSYPKRLDDALMLRVQKIDAKHGY
jgi:hypothetical protein